MRDSPLFIFRYIADNNLNNVIWISINASEYEIKKKIQNTGYRLSFR